MKKCDEVITRAKTAGDKEPWDSNDLKAINYIYSSISDRQMEFIGDYTTAFEIIKKFDSLYLKEPTALQIVCRNKLEKLKSKNYSNCATFFGDFDKYVNGLKSAGASVTEKEKLSYVLNTLPESYSYIGDLIDTSKEEDQTADYVKNKIQLAEMKSQKEENFKRRSNAFMSIGRTCYKCGKEAHIQTQGRNYSWRSARGNCQQSRPSISRGNYVRERGRNQQDTSAHQAEQYRQQNEDSCAWITRVDYNGCTDHIITNDKYFENFKILEKPVNVYLGDNSYVKATKIGNVISYFDVYGKKVKIEMKNVFYVENMHSNLVSYSKITENNKIISEDDYSKIARAYTIKSKAEVYDCFVQYVNKCENLTGKRGKMLRCDNAEEYSSKNVYNFAREKGIIIKPCRPYVHQLNGVAESFNRRIMNLARYLLQEAQIHKKYWPETVSAATYLKNRTLTNTVEKKTPYEIFFGRKSDFSNLKLYGSKAFLRIPEQKGKSKWDKNAEMGVLVGYSENGYRILINGSITVARNIEIVEQGEKCIDLNFNESDDENFEIDKNSENESLDETFESIGENSEIHDNENKLKIPRRSERIKSCLERFDEYKMYAKSSSIFANCCRVDIPYTFEEAINSEESKSLKSNNTWELIENTENKKVIDVKWVYNKKSDNIYKARLVVRGFQQKEGIDDIYAPVAKMQTLKILLSYCCRMDLMIEQMDVETAFLNCKVTSEVYVRQPKSYEDGTNRVCKLIKALYRLKESPRAWYECLDKFLLSIGFVRNNLDYCLHILKNENDILYLLIYGDDLLICSKNESLINIIKNLLSNRFKMKDMGKIKEYLGITVEYKYYRKILKQNQTNYITY
ncbi:unnamed protein product [Hermetia illucens]|uniref:Integrase catalytic domain-containing protein n=1 Tax=Hermetia illucens TaxID=343691 RepID=A0A7R8UWF5_HERIL|nr:unnamed protein product [Hermetia illucens]